MKRKDIKELHQLTKSELEKKLADYLAQLNKLQMDLSVHKLADTRSVSKLKDDIARVKTVIKIKELTNDQKEDK